MVVDQTKLFHARRQVQYRILDCQGSGKGALGTRGCSHRTSWGLWPSARKYFVRTEQFGWCDAGATPRLVGKITQKEAVQDPCTSRSITRTALYTVCLQSLVLYRLPTVPTCGGLSTLVETRTESRWKNRYIATQ